MKEPSEVIVFKLVDERLVDENGIPRRVNEPYLSKTEKRILDTIRDIEKFETNPLLTDAIVLLTEVKDIISDYVDLDYPNRKAL